jgi:bifunctional UDP-N-acetylglucosamine pyrophosphorylase/glucosamine-1-phosphate N-acetyltransferase
MPHVDFTAVVMAAGRGTRMRSRTPKVLHELCGLPMVAWPVLAALEAGASKVVVVCSPNHDLSAALPDGVVTAVQEIPDGTGGAVAAALQKAGKGTLVVLSGDVPLVTAQEIAALVAEHAKAGNAATMLTTELEDASGYGRVVRDGDGAVLRVVETKNPGDATAQELAIAEVNTGIFCFDAAALAKALKKVGTDNAQGERYLPDVLPLLNGQGVGARVVDNPALVLGINDRAQLAEAHDVAQQRILREHMLAGVTIVDPGTTLVDAGVTIGEDSVIEPATYLRGTTTIGGGSQVGPNTTVIDARIGDDVTIRHSYIDRAIIDNGATVGPFAYLRPDAHLHEGAKAGTFVEIKNSEIGAGSKVPHLSYIGDADVGERSNLGAGTITANYDGTNKHRTTIGSGVKSGVDVSFVAPVEVGDNAWTAAGSIITKDVPPGALGVARQRQKNVEDYADRGKKEK